MTKPLTKEQKCIRKAARTCEVKKGPSDKVRKLASDIAAKGGYVEDGVLHMPLTGRQSVLGLEPTKLKLSGFNGEALKQTTPEQVQDAANEYFDKKSAWEKCKDAVELALEHIGAEMAALNVQSVIVRNLDGEPTIVRIKKSSKLEIKKIK